MGTEELQLRPNQQAFIERFTQACGADERVVAAFLGGSNVKGKADQHSDLDLCVITTADSLDDFYSRRESFLQSLGQLVFLENFEIPNIAFYIFADGTEGELNFGSENRLDQIRSGPFRILLDKKGILNGAVFPEATADPVGQAEKLRSSISGFWHEMSHFITAIGRGQLWWARGQLSQLRGICVNLARLQHDFLDEGAGSEPYFKLEDAMDVRALSALESTFSPMERAAMLQAVWVILDFYRGAARPLAQMHRIPYPHQLEAVMTERLEKLSAE